VAGRHKGRYAAPSPAVRSNRAAGKFRVRVSTDPRAFFEQFERVYPCGSQLGRKPQRRDKMTRFSTQGFVARAVLAGGAALSAAGAANAAVIVIDDRLDDPAPIGIFANDFEGGLSINGNLFQQG